MARWAIGDLQGCHTEFRLILERIRFNADRDQVWLTGDLVNRGPDSLKVLRTVRSLGANLVTVLGNHDLHLLAVALTDNDRLRKSDTLEEILEAPDCDVLLDWLIDRPLAHYDGARNDLLIHAGLVPQWSAVQAAALAREVSDALRHDPEALLGKMYGDEPRRWDASLEGAARLRFVVNVLTRLRACTADGEVDLKQKGAPESLQPPLFPWFAVEQRESRTTRVIFGHWSALGLMQRARLVALDTGCVWGGSLTAINLDDQEVPPVSVPAVGASKA
jgi:bis(5'-nucleosyl)-tetraphosphatase (symmetrical)